MTIKELQDLVDAFENKEGTLPRGELALTAALTAQTANLTQIAARKLGSAKAKPENTRQMAAAVAQAMWTLTAIANASDIDMTEALVDNLGK